MTIPAGVLREIVAHARETWPRECCGLLIGTAGAVVAVSRARNEQASRTRYLVSPEDHFAAVRRARRSGLDVVGAYHSHPAGRPHPSATDREEAHGEGFLYVIAGTRRLRRRCRRQSPGRTRNAGARPSGRRTARARRTAQSLQAQGCWVAAWRLVTRNFVQVPLVRVP